MIGIYWLTWIRHPKMENKNKFERMDDADVRPNEEAFVFGPSFGAALGGFTHCFNAATVRSVF
jgi:hypothetical protein